jgi:HEAT repeat protein
MKRLIPIIPLLILALIFGFACTGTGLEVEFTEPKPNFNIESLIEDLKDENSNTRESAAMVLGNTGDGQSVEPLIEALRDEDDDVRQWAAWALGNIGDNRAVEPLIGALGDEDRNVRLDAAWALGNIGDSKAVEPLIEVLLNDKSSDVQRNAAKALGNIGEPALEPLLKMLGNEDGNVRQNAAIALGTIGDSRAVEPLIAALEGEFVLVRQNAATALGQIRDARAVEPLIEALLKDTNWDVIKNAAIALGNIGEPAVEPLFKALEGEGNYVQMRVVMALGYINDPSAVEFLTDALKDKKLDIIAGAYYFFIRRGEEGTEDILIEALNKHGNVNMAEDYLNCGNGQLEKAARTWATDHGYTITEWPIGDSGKSWGANK